MTKHFVPARPRGLIGGVKADMTPQALHTALMQTFEQFKSSVDEELGGIKAKFEDVVTKDKVDKINAEVSRLEKALGDANKAIAAAQIGAGGGDENEYSAERREHAKAFNKFFRRGVDAGLSDLEVKAALSTDSDPDGGYVVPVEMDGTIDQIAREYSAMRGLCAVRSIGTDTYKKLINMGGSGSGWVGEKEERPETGTPTLREIIINVQEMYANPAATQKALDDSSMDIAQWLADEVVIEFAEQESEAFITGDGVNKPKGLWSYDKVANASWEWGKFGYVASGKADGFLAPTATVSPADALIDLVYAQKQVFRNGSTFLMNDTTAQVVRKFKDNEGAFLWREPTLPEDVPTILGKRVVTDDYAPVIAPNSYPIAFGNFQRAYTIFDRQGTRVLRDPFTNKPYIHFYTTKRVGGGATHFQPMKFLKIATS